jgi:hypothetical protein
MSVTGKFKSFKSNVWDQGDCFVWANSKLEGNNNR